MPDDNNAIARVMPHSAEAEKAVIAAMLMDRKAIARARQYLTPKDFYVGQYGKMFEIICALDEEGLDVDIVTVQGRMQSLNLPPESYSDETFTNILYSTATSANVVSYAKIVLEKSMLRQTIRISEEAAQKAYQGEEDVDDILAAESSDIFKLAQHMDDDYVPIRQVVLNTMDKIYKASQVDGTITGIATGFADLDLKTAGLQPSDLVLIAARPSMGKTAFVLNIADNVAIRPKEPKNVAIFSLEMSKEQLMNRLLAMESHVDSQKIRTGTLDEGEWSNLIESATKIGDSGLIIDDTPGITVPQLRAKCQKYMEEVGLDMVIIDYLQLMNAAHSRASDSRQNEISEISRSLKALARELKVPVVALSQLSRAVEARPDKRPMLSDLRESGAIEQDADVVMFIYRDDYYHPDSEDKGVAEIIISKQRNGPLGTVRLKWIPELTRFANLASPALAGGAN
ncbi:MAG: replicative DNA helicase [Lachnospiraceae bacterium]|jgi:replicative DNA helicase